MTQTDDAAAVEDLLTRGVENIIPGKDLLKKELLSGKKLNVYLGIDPTAAKIHLGHAFPLRKLEQLADLGHNVTFLIGDYTTRVGDTSDKDGERPMLSPEQIEENFQTFKQQAEKFLDFSKVNLKYNSEWLSKLDFNDVMQLMSHFSVNDFISRELIRKRLDSGGRVALPEVLYPLMQGYDSYFMDTDIQFGGTDQTFNMQAGRTLQKRLRDKESFIIANGFLTGTDGRKMSKSWGNAIWLEDSPEDIFGKVMSIKDDLVEEYFIYGTALPLEEVAKHMETAKDQPMEAKKALARRIVVELHGESAVEAAEKHFVDTVQNKSAGDDSPQVEWDKQVISGQDLLRLIVENDLAQSNSEARRLFEQNSIRVNDQQIKLEDESKLIEGSNTVRVGKRRYLIINRV